MPNLTKPRFLIDSEVRRIVVVAQAIADLDGGNPHFSQCYLPSVISLGLLGVRPVEIISLKCDDVTFACGGENYIRSAKEGNYRLAMTDDLWKPLIGYFARKKESGLFQTRRETPLTVSILGYQIRQTG